MDVLLGSPDHLAQLEEHLLLIRRIVSEPAPPVRRRGWLLEQCRRRGDDERELWRALVRYRQIGAPGLLTADRSRSRETRGTRTRNRVGAWQFLGSLPSYST